MPPLSGKILWARQLLRHIEEIMERLKVKKSVLLTAQGKAVVRKYNKMALVLTEYEIVHYQSWLKIVEICHKNVKVFADKLKLYLPLPLKLLFSQNSMRVGLRNCNVYLVCYREFKTFVCTELSVLLMGLVLIYCPVAAGVV